MKNIFNKKTIFTAITTVVLFLLIKPMMAYAGFGVSPININKEHLKPGATVTETISVSRSNANESTRITVEPDLGEIESWFTFSPGKEFIFEAGAVRKDFQITIKVPQDTELKEYTGIILSESKKTHWMKLKEFQ